MWTLRRTARLVEPGLSIPMLALLLALAGCSRDAANPLNASRSASASRDGAALASGPSVSGAYFPLQIGNRWHTEAESRNRITPTNGGPIEDFVIHDDITRVLVGTETISGRTYVVEADSTEETTSTENLGSFLTWIRYRQDASGLYEADVAISTPPALAARVQPFPARLSERLPEGQREAFAAAWDRVQQRAAALRAPHRGALSAGNAAGRPGGVGAEEITRLSYPLRPGAEWVIRGDPFFGSVVEANENFEAPAGRFPSSRIRTVADFLGPNDLVHVWFSRSGMLALRYHLESFATDVDGNIIGTASFDYDETLRDFSLAGP